MNRLPSLCKSLPRLSTLAAPICAFPTIRSSFCTQMKESKEDDVYDPQGVTLAHAEAPKANFDENYHLSGPEGFAANLGQLDYGAYQQPFIDFSKPMIEQYIKTKDNKNPTLIDIGVSYGNTTLNIVADKDWEECKEFWFDEKRSKLDKKGWHTIGVDISDEALAYDLERGILDETFKINLNEEQIGDDLADALRRSDVLSCLMSSCYFDASAWQKLVDLFLSDRSRDKLVLYNLMIPFDTRLFEIGAQAVFNDHKNVLLQSMFTKHRNFTKFESEQQYGHKEAWTILFCAHAKKL